MRTKLLFTAVSMLALEMVGTLSSAQADDVYVDLSVLEHLNANQPSVMNNGPLFPVVSATQEKKVYKAPKVKKKKISLPQPVSQEKTVEKKLNIPEKSEIKVPTEIKIEKDIKEPIEQNIQEKEQKTEISQGLKENEPAKVDTVIPVKETLNKKEVVSEPKAETNPVVIQSENKVKEENKVSDENKENISSKETIENLPVKTESLLQNVNEPTQAEKVETPALLIPTTPVIEKKEKVDNEIIFAADSDELSDANKTQIDQIIGSFDNAKENKIAIYSYNLNDGEDSFRRKRMSLNRAIAARSYLLGQGYKNFSIKVVNLNEADGKEHSIKIEELK